MIRAYLQQRGKRGSKKVPSNFHEKLELWLSELTTNQGTKWKGLYWTLKGYALANKISLHPFMAWFRTLEEVAKKMYPDRVPVGRRDKSLTEEIIQAIRADYLQADYTDRKAVEKIAAKYGIEKFRVGQLCRKEKQIRNAEWERRLSKAEAGRDANPDVQLLSGEVESPF